MDVRSGTRESRKKADERAILFIRMPPWDKWNIRFRIGESLLKPKESSSVGNIIFPNEMDSYLDKFRSAVLYLSCDSDEWTRKHRIEILIQIKRDTINIRVSRANKLNEPFSAHETIGINGERRAIDRTIQNSWITRRPSLGSSDPKSTKTHRDWSSRDNIVGECFANTSHERGQLSRS